MRSGVVSRGHNKLHLLSMVDSSLIILFNYANDLHRYSVSLISCFIQSLSHSAIFTTVDSTSLVLINYN